MRSLLAVLALAAGCSGGGGGKSPLAADLDQICNAIERSGATDLEPADRAYTIAMWLPANVSQAGRDWLVEWAQLGEDKPARRAMLERAAKQAGVKDCPLLAMW